MNTSGWYKFDHICMFTWTLLFCDSSQCNICRVEVEVVLRNCVAHLISPEFKISRAVPHQCTEIKGLHFILQALLEWDCHMLIISFPLVSYYSMQFSDAHAGHLETGLRLRNPDILYPISISHQTPLFHISPSPGTTILHPVHPVETVLYKVFQVWKPWDHLAPIRAQMRRETITKMLCQRRRSLYSPSCATRFPSNAVKICPCISFHSRDVALNWL